MAFHRTCLAATALFSLALATPALSQVESGADDGSAVGGPNPNSAAAEADFFADAGAYGSIYTLTFEGEATGYSTSYLFPGVSATTTSPNFGDGFSGVTTTTWGNLYGYDIDTGTGTWFGAPGGSTAFTFDQPTNAFGFYLTGLQMTFGEGVTVTDSLGNIYNIAANTEGGAQFFGITLASAVTGFTITDNGGPDAWGLDRLSFVQDSTVPEPSTWAMMLIGFGGLGHAIRRRRRSGKSSQTAALKRA